MTRLAARRSALLSLLFLAVYGGCNWLAAHRPDVGDWHVAWERRMPFWPPMIVPYLSIDAFFLAAPFLCRDREELGVFTRRIVFTILVAGVCFVWMPLRFGFERPIVDGRFGALFHALDSFDRPFNLFPSLHVALAAILADVYGRRTTGVVRLAAAIWFVLIGLSPIFTYQHHAVDVAGGLALAVLACYAVQAAPSRRRSARNLRVAGYYLLGAGAGASLAAAAWPWGAVLLWPATSLAVVGAAYLGVGPAVFRKSNGTIARSAWLVLWPCLVGQWISLGYYRRLCRACDEIAPGVWIGRRLGEREAAAAVERGVTAVLDLTAELSEAPGFTRLPYRNLQVLDLTAPTAEQLHEAVRFITAHARRGVVYVHCKVGYSRSAAAVAAYLLAAGRARTTDQALAIIRRARPSIVVRPEVIASLRQFEATLLRAGAQLPRRSIPAAIVSVLLVGVARLVCGAPPRWAGGGPGARQRIYFANHTSHLDFLVLWASLPPAVRANTRPVAGRDYWDRGPVRRYLARHVVRAVLVDRSDPARRADREATVALARRSVERTARALATGASLIIFPEGTRGSGADVGPFKSGLYHLCRMRPDVELVPVFLADMHRILPKGEALPVPLFGSVTFGRPIRLAPGEDKQAFLARARRALMTVDRPCTSFTTAISRAS